MDGLFPKTMMAPLWASAICERLTYVDILAQVNFVVRR